MVVRLSFILVLLSLVSCATDVNWKPVSYGHLLHDGNSKVWLVDAMINKNGMDVGSLDRDDKNVLIFYFSGSFMYQSVRDMGTSKGRKGSYLFDTEKKSLSLIFDSSEIGTKAETWHYSFETVTEDSIYIAPLKKSKAELGLKLISYPEF